MATLKEDKSHDMGLHEEQLKGRTQQRFFSVDESENLTYFHSFDVDTSKSASIDALDMTPREINREIRELMEKGIGNITVDNPMSRHGVGVGILNRLNLTFSDSLGYFGCGLIDGPNVHIKGRVGWSCAENMMAGTVVIDKNAVLLSVLPFVVVILYVKVVLVLVLVSTKKEALLLLVERQVLSLVL